MKIIDIHQHFSIPEYFDYLEKNNALMEDSILLPRKSVSEMIAMLFLHRIHILRKQLMRELRFAERSMKRRQILDAVIPTDSDFMLLCHCLI